MNDFARILSRAKALDAACGSPTLVMMKLDESAGKSVTLRYSDVIDLETLLSGLVTALETCRRARQ